MIINDFQISLNFKRVLNIAECYEDNPLYYYVKETAENLVPLFYDSIMPVCIFDLSEFKINEYNNIIPVVYSLGNKITSVSENCFINGEYMNGIILNAMADDYLMQMDKIILSKISNSFDYCFKRLVPAENIDISFQNDICNLLDSRNKIGVFANKSFVLNPAKSLSFILAISDKKAEELNHNCSCCYIQNCRWRGTND